MSFNKPWAYSDSANWSRRGLTEGKGTNQSPINIIPKESSDCDSICKIALKYGTSKCTASVKNKTPIVYFDTGSYIKFTKNKEILSLKAMTIHTPSLHSIDGVFYDMEVVLYHKLSGSLNKDSENWTPGGTAISIMFQKGIDYGPQNNFFNSFIHKIPIDKENVAEQFDIDVGDKWGPEMIIPQIKTYYYYNGSLPFPPAEEEWKWIVFEEIQQISGNIIEALKIAFNNNTRPIQPLNGRVAAYNPNVDFDFDKALERKSTEAEANKKANEIANKLHGTTDDNEEVSSADKMKIVDMEKARTAEWYKSRKMYIKGLLICGVFILIIYAALRFVKYIIKNDVLNKIMVEQALKSKFKEQEFKSKNNNSSAANNKPPAANNKPPAANQQPSNNSSMNNSSSNNASSNNSSKRK
jgi:carbonic anhydrase